MNNLFYGKILRESSPYQINNINQNTSNQRVIETIFNVGGTNETINDTKIKNLTEKTQNISKDMIVSSTAKLLNKAINEAAANNSAEITKALSASNKISISGAKGKGFTLKGVDQRAEVKSKTEGEIVQKIANKMNNDMSNSISKSFEQASSDVKKLKEDISKGTSLGDGVAALGELGGKIADGAAKVASRAVNVGGTNREVNKKELENTLRETLNLSENFKVDDNDEVENIIKNQMSQENLAKCAEEAAAANEINLADIDAGDGPIEISDIKQTALVDSAMKCAFNQEIVNEMANKIVNDLEKTFKKVSDSMSQEERSEKYGDLLALGEGSAMLMAATGEAVGDAAVGLGEGVSTAAKGAGEGIKSAGEGVATAAKGVGEGVGAIGAGLMMPLIIIAVIGIIGLVGFMVFRNMMASEE